MAPTFTDNCDPTVPAVEGTPVSTQGVDPEACSYYNYTITRTWTATDACGNESLVYTQVITVQDTEDPLANQLAGALNQTLECDNTAGRSEERRVAKAFSDNCDPTVPAVEGTPVSTQGVDPEACS